MEKKDNTTFGVGFIIGALSSAVLITLLGTKEGRKTARLLIDKIDDYLKDVEKNINFDRTEVIEKAEELKEEAISKVEEIKETMLDRFSEVKDDVSKITKLGTSIIEENPKINSVQEKGREIAQRIGQKFFTKQGKQQN